MSTNPTTDLEWTIHSINIHGVFFERWCQKTIESTPPWKVVSTQYPVDFVSSGGRIRGNESALDIRAELNRDDQRITLLVECKKNNPDFVNWVFFPSPEYIKSKESSVVLSMLKYSPPKAHDEHWSVHQGAKNFGLKIPMADEAREVRGTYLAYQKGDKTKTANNAVSDASYQIALAAQAVLIDEHNVERRYELGADCIHAAKTVESPPDWMEQIFVPVIVTTAHLHLCEFDVNDVNPSTGELPFSKAAINIVPYLVFEYPLPRHLQLTSEAPINMSTLDPSGRWMRMSIIVVHSGELVNFLNAFAKNPDDFVGKYHRTP